MRENTEQTERDGTNGKGESSLAISVSSVSFRLFRVLSLTCFSLLPVVVATTLFPVSTPKANQELVWSAQSSGVMAKLSGVAFVDHNRGWVVGSNGTLLITEDGGAKWRRQALPERQRNEALNDVWFFNADHGLLLGEYGMFNRKGDIDWSERIFLLRSRDRGANWEAGALARLPVQHATEQARGQATGQTTRRPENVSDRNQRDGSDVLKPGQRPSDPVLLRMAFAKDQVGWAVGEAGTIQYTNDGGETWKLQEPPTRKLLYDVAVVDNKQAWAVGAGGTVLRTVDGGQNWKEQSSGVTQTLRAVQFVDAKRGWAVGTKGTIITTINGGARWQPQTSDVALNLNDVFFVNSKEGQREGQREVWVAGDRGLLLHTNNGGATWESVELNTHANLARLFFIAPDCGWVVGTSGAIFKYGQIQTPQK